MMEGGDDYYLWNELFLNEDFLEVSWEGRLMCEYSQWWGNEACVEIGNVIA